MITPELIDYIRQRKQFGITKEGIVLALLSVGWSMEDINAGYARAESPDGLPKPPPPPVGN